MIQRSILIFVVFLSFVLCKKDSNNDDLTVAALAALAGGGYCNGSAVNTGVTVSKGTATLDASSGCVTGVTTCMDSSLPSWIKDNFKCSVAYVSGSSYVFKSQNIPNTKSYYYGSTSPLFEALPAGNMSAGNNSVSSQKLVYTIPSTPSKGSGTVGTQGGLVAIGITVNGLAIFNNAANPPDTLAVEAQTFDNFGGHPQNTGVYHHHAAVTKVSNNDANLIGVILDGYAIYGKKCDNGTAATGDDFTPADLDALHGHTKATIHFSTPTYHYHFAADATAGIDTLMGSFFYGVVGSVSN